MPQPEPFKTTDDQFFMIKAESKRSDKSASACADDSLLVKQIQMFIFPAAQGIESNTVTLKTEMETEMDVTIIDMPAAAIENPYHLSIKEITALVIDEVVCKYHESRKTVFFGQCYGSRIAHEAATFLESKGKKIDLLVITDVATSDNYVRKPANEILALSKRLAKYLAVEYAPSCLLRRASNRFLKDSKSKTLRKIEQWSREVLRVRHCRSWNPRVLKAKSLLVLSVDTRKKNIYSEDGLGWARICSALQIITVGKSHLSYTQTPESSFLRTVVTKSVL